MTERKHRTMARRRTLKAILANFLGHFTSRYADHDGYWIFGLVVTDLRATTIDLLGVGGEDAETRPLGAVIRLARAAFHDQLAKGRLDVSRVREARLDISRHEVPATGLVGNFIVDGYSLVLSARAVSDLGVVYARRVTIFVAPHDPRLERRSARLDRSG
jgi:hypothetical protein